MNQQKHTRKPSVRRRTSSRSTKGRNLVSDSNLCQPSAHSMVAGRHCRHVSLIWLFYSFFVSPTGFRWRALFGDVNYPAGYEIHGTDISHYQGDIDWDRLRGGMIEGCPLRFIMIKSTEGSSRMDSKFRDNFRQAREYGYIREAYHFWSNKSSARDQAYFFLNNVHLEEDDLPPVLDIEHMPKDRSVEDFQRDVLTWLHIVERTVITSNPLSTHIINLRSVISTPPSLTTILTG